MSLFMKKAHAVNGCPEMPGYFKFILNVYWEVADGDLSGYLCTVRRTDL